MLDFLSGLTTGQWPGSAFGIGWLKKIFDNFVDFAVRVAPDIVEEGENVSMDLSL